MEKLRPTKSDERNPAPKQLIKVTNRAVEKLTPPECGYIIGWDKEVKGFGIRATAAGVRSFIVNYRLRGDARRKTPGRYGALVADEARDKAKAWLRDVAEGIDPAKERQA